MCECLQKIRENLRENDPTIGAITVECDNVYDVDPATGRKTGEPKTGQPIEVYHQLTKRDGSPKHTRRKSFLAHIHCPFCGDKYE